MDPHELNKNYVGVRWVIPILNKQERILQSMGHFYLKKNDILQCILARRNFTREVSNT